MRSSDAERLPLDSSMTMPTTEKERLHRGLRQDGSATEGYRLGQPGVRADWGNLGLLVPQEVQSQRRGGETRPLRWLIPPWDDREKWTTMGWRP